MNKVPEIVPRPPVSKQTAGGTDWQGVVDFAKAHPGEWVRIGPFSGGMLTAIKRGLIAPFFRDNPSLDRDTLAAQEWIKSRWNLTTRLLERTETTRKVDIYLQFVGEQ